jgi:hypothetical protein
VARKRIDSPSDEGLLEQFGYKQELRRGLGLWTNFAVGFAFISPVVGLYAIIALGTFAAGPAWVWTLPVVLAASSWSRACSPSWRPSIRSRAGSTSGAGA